MPDRYYVQISRRAFGPFSSEALREMVAQGRIESTTLLSLDKQTWAPASAFPDLFSDVVISNDVDALPLTSVKPLAKSAKKNDGAQKWLISVDGRESAGSFTTRELFDSFRAGKISSETLVWRQGDKNSHKLGDVEEIRNEFESFQSASDPFVKERRQILDFQDVATSPRRNSERFATKIKTRFLSAWICIGVMTIAAIGAAVLQRYGIASLNIVDFTLGSLVYLFAGLAFIGAVLFSAAFLHAFWSIVPKEIARANPNEAVAFLFVPGFGFYWIFQALYGGAVDANEALKRYGVSDDADGENALFVSPGWALATGVFFDLGGPFNPISGFFFLLCLGVTTVQMKKVALKLDSLQTTCP